MLHTDIMITYTTCWAIEQANVANGTNPYDWRLLGTCETNLFVHEIIADINSKAKHRHEKFPRDDLYYDEESKVLYRVTESKHWFRSKSKKSDSGNPFDCPI